MFARVRDYLKTFKGQVVVALTIVTIGCAWGIYQNRQLTDDFIAESEDRRSQSCELTEREHLRDVENLKQTYKYIDALRPEEIDDTINQFIIRNIAETEAAAREDRAPEYCDEPGIGLPEPDPELPPERDFSNLLIER